MEEDIKILDEVVGRSKELREKDFGMLIGTKQMHSIENLIKGYRELEERHKQLFECYHDRVGEIINLENELESVKEIYYTQKEIETDYITKSKIKEKIEEYKKTLNKGENKYILSGYYETKIQVLQQLMEDK